MGVSYRQAKQIRRREKRGGLKGLVYGNRGKPTKRRISKKVLHSGMLPGRLSGSEYWASSVSKGSSSKRCAIYHYM